MDDTLVVMTSDHGEAFFEEDGYVEHEETTRDMVLHVPLALWKPDVPTGKLDGRVQLADVTTSVLDLLRIPAEPYDMDGKSLLVDRRPDTRERTMVSEFNLGATDDVVGYEGPWRLVNYPNGGGTRLYHADAGAIREDVSALHPGGGGKSHGAARPA